MSSTPNNSESAAAASPKKFNWGLLLKLLLTATILFLIFRKNNWAQFASEIKNAHPFWIACAFISLGTGLALGALRWNLLLRVQGIFLKYRQTAVYTLIGIFFSQFLPASTGGDVIKVFYIIKDAPDRKARAALSIVLDRVFGLLAILLLTLALVPLEYDRIVAHPQIRLFILFLGLLVAGIFTGLLLLWFVPLPSLPPFCRRLWGKMPKQDVFASLYEGFQAHRQSPRMALAAVLVAVVAVVPVLSTGYFVARAMELDVSYAQMTIIFSLVLCSISLPISFGGHGLREGVFVLLFHIFSISRAGMVVPEETAKACSILYLGVSLVWSLAGGLVYLLYSHNIKKNP